MSKDLTVSVTVAALVVFIRHWPHETNKAINKTKHKDQ
jgi:hypothetical protein